MTTSSIVDALLFSSHFPFLMLTVFLLDSSSFCLMILEGAEFVKHDGIIEKQISEEGRTHSDLLLSYFNAILNPNTHTKKTPYTNA